MTKVAPFLRVADAEASVEWYARLGFSVAWRTHAEPHLPLFVANGVTTVCRRPRGSVTATS